MSYDAENTTAESLERAEQQRDPVQLQQQLEREPSLQLSSHIDCDPLQLQSPQERDPLQLQHQQQQREALQLQQQRDALQLQQQRDALQLQQQRETMQLQQQRRAEREQMQFYQREKEQQFLQVRDNIQSHQRDHLHQLQSINNLLLDLPPSSNKSSHSIRSCETPYTPFLKGSNPEGKLINTFSIIVGKFGQRFKNSSLVFWDSLRKICSSEFSLSKRKLAEKKELTVEISLLIPESFTSTAILNVLEYFRSTWSENVDKSKNNKQHFPRELAEQTSVLSMALKSASLEHHEISFVFIFVEKFIQSCMKLESKNLFLEHFHFFFCFFGPIFLIVMKRDQGHRTAT